MPRLVGAAIQLATQVQAMRPHSVINPVGSSDELDRFRGIRFDPGTSSWLAPTLDVILDERIAAMEFEGKRLIVYFVPDVRSENRDLYPLIEAMRVVEETS